MKHFTKLFADYGPNVIFLDWTLDLTTGRVHYSSYTTATNIKYFAPRQDGTYDTKQIELVIDLKSICD